MKNHERIPLNTLAIPFGLAGLVNAWTVAEDELNLPAGVGMALLHAVPLAR